MIIRGAALVNRFYVQDGWTWEKVVDLLVDPEKDKEDIVARFEKEDNFGFPIPIDAKPQYYACYMPDVAFDRKKVEKHEFQTKFDHITFERGNLLK